MLNRKRTLTLMTMMITGLLLMMGCGGSGGGSDSDGDGGGGGTIESGLQGTWVEYQDPGFYAFDGKALEILSDGNVWNLTCYDAIISETCDWTNNYDDLEGSNLAASGGRMTMDQDGTVMNAAYTLDGDNLTVRDLDTSELFYFQRANALIGCSELRDYCEGLRAPCYQDDCDGLDGSAWTDCLNACQDEVADCYSSYGGDPRGISCDEVNWCACDW